jgi:hypothetical protein
MAIKLDIKTVTNLKTPGRYTDALVKGLHIWVKSNQRKYWIFRFSHAGKQHIRRNRYRLKIQIQENTAQEVLYFLLATLGCCDVRIITGSYDGEFA